MTNRHDARVLSLKSLYELDMTHHSMDKVIELQVAAVALPTDQETFARAVISSTLQKQEEIDELIHRLAPTYPVLQMAPIDRNILRLAIYEILHDNSVPVRVAINEAVELAKEFGSDSSAKFINGVLSTVATLARRD
ncbi:transcription antitermination factor NusB [Dehalogenimonas sp. THU2]|uniref:transcription antitermination factor NusB n=1 Tax=Dehalogenimonas sp. THU2 TaxID=3151121 RepID=UPI00321865E1